MSSLRSVSSLRRHRELELGGRLRRVGAALLDGIALAFPLWQLYRAYRYAYDFSGMASTSLWSYFVWGLLLVLGYQVLCLLAWRRTIGMAAFGLVVVSVDGRPASAGQCGTRAAVGCLSLLALGVGFLWSFLHPLHQTWHDYAANTLVVRARSLSRKRR